MLVLDENLPAGQRSRLLEWRVHFRVIGADVAAIGTDDENLIPVLHRLPQRTFFSLDRDFHRPEWRHAHYCLVWLDVADDRAAEFIRRFLKHPQFDTQAKRLGTVLRVQGAGLQFWRVGGHQEHSAPWPEA